MSEENYRKKKSEAFFDSEDESASKQKKAKAAPAAPKKTAAARKSVAPHAASALTASSTNVDAKAWLFSDSEDEREEESVQREHNSVYSRRVAGGSIRRRALLSGDLLAELRLYNPDEVRGLDGYERCDKAVVWLRYLGDSNSSELLALKKFLKIAKTKFTEEGTFLKSKK